MPRRQEQPMRRVLYEVMMLIAFGAVIALTSL